MNIQATMYGYNKLIFLADSASQSDVEGLVKLVTINDTQINESKFNNCTQIRFRVGSSIYFSESKSSIRSRIVVAMLPYQMRLQKSSFIAAEIKGDKQITRVLEAYEFPMIIASEESELQEFRKRYPESAQKYGVRKQSQEEIQSSIGLISSAVPELRQY